MLGSRGYSGLQKIVEEDRSTPSLDRLSRPSTMERRATMDSLLLKRPKSVERRMTLDSIRTLSPMKVGHVRPLGIPRGDTDRHDADREKYHMPRHSPDMLRDRVDSFESDASLTSHHAHAYPLRSLSLADHQMTETEKRYFASLDQRRDALDTRMLPSVGNGYKAGRGEPGRWSLPAGYSGYNQRSSSFASNTSEPRPKTPMNITRLRSEDTFGTREELYKVDMEDGLTYVCRKRADSITNPNLMTGAERRILGFLEGAARLSRQRISVTSDNPVDERERMHRIYSLGEGKLVVDPVMSKYAAKNRTKRKRQSQTHERRASHPSQTLLPPVYKQQTFRPQQRDFSIPPGPRTTPEFTDEVCEQLKDCRYLRPPLRKYQDVPEDIEEEEEDNSEED